MPALVYKLLYCTTVLFKELYSRLKMFSLFFVLFFVVFFCGTRASYCFGLSRYGAQAPDLQAQRPWLTGPAASRHVGSSRTGAQTRVPCIGRQTPNHCATREAQENIFNLTVQSLEKYSSTVQQLAYRGWHRVNRQEELLTGGGRGGGR